jgi:type II secretory pathway pseudopilin PulG
VPPCAEISVGFALTTTRPTPAEPTAIRIALLPLADAPPELAEMMAVPFMPPALNIALACPLTSVSTSDGEIVPSDVVKITCVPLCGGVPAGSSTCAINWTDPLLGTAVFEAVSEMVDPEGASSGTFWHAAAAAASTQTLRTRERRRFDRVIMKAVNILKPMQLERQTKSEIRVGNDRGYAMAALLVAIGIMMVMMTVAMPVWKQAAQREKEEELVFRGQQYVHAIALFSRKYANAFPPNLNVLFEQRFLRKKYKDPITNDDFQPIPVGQQGTPGISGPAGSGQRQTGPGGRDSEGATTTGRDSGPGQTGGRSTSPTTSGPAAGRGTPLTGGTGGIIGVVSKSKDKSIRLYNGRGHYNEWAFLYTAQMQAPGAGAPGAVAPGQRGQPGAPGIGQPGQRGRGNNPFGTTPGRGGPGRGGPGRGGNQFPGGISPFEPPPTRGRSGR